MLIASVCSQHRTKTDASVATERSGATFQLDITRAQSDLAQLTSQPHPLGSLRQGELSSWLVSRLTSDGIHAVQHDFKAVTPNTIAPFISDNAHHTTALDGHNVYAMDIGRPNPPCVVALASHFDTKNVSGADYLGANDSGSSTAVLLQLLAHLKKHAIFSQTNCGFVGWFFDGEESVLANWHDGEESHPARMIDHTYGSRMLASKLVTCTFAGKRSRCLPPVNGQIIGPALVAMVLLDMVGSPQLKLSRDLHSSPELQRIAQSGADASGLSEIFTIDAVSIEDDHRPFRTLGVPAIDLIDFHHLQHWHQPSDRVESLSTDSMNIAGNLALYVASSVANQASPALPSVKNNRQ